MKFEEALIELRNGKIIKCEGTDDVISLEIIKKVGFNHFFRCDLVINDNWEVVEEPGKTFPEVFESFKEGKKIKRKSWKTKLFYNDEYERTLTQEDLLATDWMVCDD